MCHPFEPFLLTAARIYIRVMSHIYAHICSSHVYESRLIYTTALKYIRVMSHKYIFTHIYTSHILYMNASPFRARASTHSTPTSNISHMHCCVYEFCLIYECIALSSASVYQRHMYVRVMSHICTLIHARHVSYKAMSHKQT